MWTVLSWSTEPSTKSVVPTIDIRSAISGQKLVLSNALTLFTESWYC